MAKQVVSVEELEALLAAQTGPTVKPSQWVQAVVERKGTAMGTDALCELACERGDSGPLETIRGLLQGLALRHADDDATLAVLTALEVYHLPDLMTRFGGYGR